MLLLVLLFSFNMLLHWGICFLVLVFFFLFYTCIILNNKHLFPIQLKYIWN